MTHPCKGSLHLTGAGPITPVGLKKLFERGYTVIPVTVTRRQDGAIY